LISRVWNTGRRTDKQDRRRAIARRDTCVLLFFFSGRIRSASREKARTSRGPARLSRTRPLAPSLSLSRSLSLFLSRARARSLSLARLSHRQRVVVILPACFSVFGVEAIVTRYVVRRWCRSHYLTTSAHRRIVYYALGAAAAFSVCCKPDAHRYIFVCRPFFGQAGARARGRDPPSGGGDAKPGGPAAAMADALSIAWHFTPCAPERKRGRRYGPTADGRPRVSARVSASTAAEEREKRGANVCRSHRAVCGRNVATPIRSAAIPRYGNLVDGANAAAPSARTDTAPRGRWYSPCGELTRSTDPPQSHEKVFVPAEIRASPGIFRTPDRNADTARRDPFSCFSRERLYVDVFEDRIISKRQTK